MKVLMVKNNRLKRDGITSVILNLIRATEAEDITFDLLAINEPEPSLRATFEALGVDIFLLQRSAKQLLRYILSLRKMIHDGKYDVVHIHGSSGTIALELLAAWLAGCKVRIAHSHNTSCTYKIAHWLLKPAVRWLCTHRMACGDAAGIWLYGNKPFIVLRNGVDTQRFAFRESDRTAIRNALAVASENVLIGHTGMFIESKNQSFLLEVLALLPERYQLLLVGEGPAMSAIRERIREMGLNGRVILTGSVEDPERYYSAFDIMTLPSMHEGLPLSLVEAQVSGLPCLVSDRVTCEVDLTGNVRFLPIGSGAVLWASAIQQQILWRRESASIAAIDKIKAHGFDIYEQAMDLVDYYRRAIGLFHN